MLFGLVMMAMLKRQEVELEVRAKDVEMLFWSDKDEDKV